LIAVGTTDFYGWFLVTLIHKHLLLITIISDMESIDIQATSGDRDIDLTIPLLRVFGPSPIPGKTDLPQKLAENFATHVKAPFPAKLPTFVYILA